MSTILLGSNGWIGSHILKNPEYRLKTLDSSNLNKHDFETWLHFQMAECYINCIGKNSGSEANMEWANIGVVEALLKHAKKTGARVITLGSASEYGDIQVPEINENLDPNPNSIYGKQKLVANQMLNEFVIDGGSGVATRIFNVIGPKQSLKTALGQITNRMRDQKAGGELVIDNYDVVRDYISLEFVVDVLVKLTSLHFNGTLNIGSGKPIILIDLLNEIGRFYNVSILPGQLHEDRIRMVVASTSTLRNLGFIPEDIALRELAILGTKN